MSNPFEERNRSPASVRKLAKLADAAGLDRRAVHTLVSTYFDEDAGVRWVTNPQPPPEPDLRHAIEMGVMRAPLDVTPEELAARVIRARDALDRHELANAFLAGLNENRPDLCSTLATYACLEAFRPSDPLPQPPYDRNAELFVRLYRGGSMEHSSPLYALADFEAFRPVPPASPELWRRLLAALRALPPEAQLTELQKVPPGNKLQRQHILECLGYLGILQPAQFAPLSAGYRRLEEQPLPPERNKREWRFPVCWWTGKDGLNEDAVLRWFRGFSEPPAILAPWESAATTTSSSAAATASSTSATATSSTAWSRAAPECAATAR